MGPQLADRLVTIDGPDGAAFAVPASPSAADAGAPAVSVVKKKLFVYVPSECVLVKFRQESMGQAQPHAGKASTMRPTTSRLRSIPL